jgi:SAM-dependent methyltransferase
MRGGLRSWRDPLDPGLVARYYRHAGSVQRVLDLGCGGGDLGRLRPDPTIEVHGIDIRPEAVAAAARWETTIRIDLAHDSLPYADATFQAVFAKDVLEHLPRPWEVLAEVHRVLEPGGRVVVSVPMEYPRVVWGDYTHVRGFTRPALDGLLVDTGFTVGQIVPMGAVPLAGRLHLIPAMPAFLRIPGMRRLFGRSWEAVATRS